MMKTMEKLRARNENIFHSPDVLIACLGDSVTHGCFETYPNHTGGLDVRYAPREGYIGKLQERLDRLYPAAAVSILNAGISGDSAPGGLNRLEQDVLCHKPDLVTVNFGLNDAMGGLEKLEGYASAMQCIMERILDSGAECILVTPNHMCGYVSPLLEGELLKDIAAKAMRIQKDGVLAAFVDAARKCAQKTGVPIADSYAVWDRLSAIGVDTTAMLVNHINHPVSDAHDIFADLILEKMLMDR